MTSLGVVREHVLLDMSAAMHLVASEAQHVFADMAAMPARRLQVHRACLARQHIALSVGTIADGLHREPTARVLCGLRLCCRRRLLRLVGALRYAALNGDTSHERRRRPKLRGVHRGIERRQPRILRHYVLVALVAPERQVAKAGHDRMTSLVVVREHVLLHVPATMHLMAREAQHVLAFVTARSARRIQVHSASLACGHVGLRVWAIVHRLHREPSRHVLLALRRWRRPTNRLRGRRAAFAGEDVVRRRDLAAILRKLHRPRRLRDEVDAQREMSQAHLLRQLQRDARLSVVAIELDLGAHSASSDVGTCEGYDDLVLLTVDSTDLGSTRVQHTTSDERRGLVGLQRRATNNTVSRPPKRNIAS
mmetsp:Transcript_75284/g.218637  ORF Transcript_75284/g.218637 Transcript_75284/m.218637 type:complete len:365 (+) Transcript_75284:117-1211(+)